MFAGYWHPIDTGILWIPVCLNPLLFTFRLGLSQNFIRDVVVPGNSLFGTFRFQ
jgi:hypothetical protein